MSNITPTGWRRVRIGDLCNVGRGSSPRPINDKRYFENGDIPWIKIADATKSGKYLYETKEKVNKFGASFSRLLPKNSLILAASGTLGCTQILGVEGCVHDGWLYLTDFKDVDKDFLFYLFKYRQSYFYNTAYGAAIQNVNTMILREMEILLPPLPTQRKIAAILSAYDDLIENNLRRIKVLEDMAQNLYREWFVNFRFPGHEKVITVDSPLGNIPEGWKTESFTAIVDILSGGTPKTSIAEYWNGDIFWFTPRDLDNSFCITSTERTITSEGLKHCNSKLYPADTVFITARGTVGKCVISAVPMAMSQTSYALRGRSGIPQPFVYLLALNLVDILKQNATGAVFDTITVDTFRRLNIIIPPTNLLKDFEDIISPMFDILKLLIYLNRNLRQTRDLLLPKLVSGELDVSDLDIKVGEAG